MEQKRKPVYTKTQLAKAYGVSLPTFVGWMKKLEIYDPDTRLISGKQMDKLEDHFGEPDYSLAEGRSAGNN